MPVPQNAFALAPVPAPASNPAQPALPASTTAPALISLDAAIELSPGATCLDRDVLVRRVARWLQRDQVEANVRVAVQGDRTKPNAVSFVIDRGHGDRAERRIDNAPQDCDQFHSALALSIALAIDATLSGSATSASAGEVLPTDEELLAKPETPEPPYFRLALGVFGQATAGLLTSVSGALSGRIEVGFLPWLDLRVGGVATRLRDQSFPNAPGSFSLELLAGRLDVCGAHTMTGSLRMAVCLGGMAGALRTRGREDSDLASLSQTALWSAVAGGVEAQAELLPWLAIAASVDLVVPLAKHRIVVTDTSGQFVVSRRELTPVAVLVGAGPIFRFF